MNPEELREFLDEEINAFMNIHPRDSYTLGRMLALYRLRRALETSDSSMSLSEVVEKAWIDHYALPDQVRDGIHHEIRAIHCLCTGDQKKTSTALV